MDTILDKIRTRRRLPDPAARRVLRERVGLSQADVAGALGVTRECISRWESGERTPRGDLLTAYVALLDRLAMESTR